MPLFAWLYVLLLICADIFLLLQEQIMRHFRGYERFESSIRKICSSIVILVPYFNDIAPKGLEGFWYFYVIQAIYYLVFLLYLLRSSKNWNFLFAGIVFATVLTMVCLGYHDTQNPVSPPFFQFLVVIQTNEEEKLNKLEKQNSELEKRISELEHVKKSVEKVANST